MIIERSDLNLIHGALRQALNRARAYNGMRISVQVDGEALDRIALAALVAATGAVIIPDDKKLLANDGRGRVTSFPPDNE